MANDLSSACFDGQDAIAADAFDHLFEPVETSAVRPLIHSKATRFDALFRLYANYQGDEYEDCMAAIRPCDASELTAEQETRILQHALRSLEPVQPRPKPNAWLYVQTFLEAVFRRRVDVA